MMNNLDVRSPELFGAFVFSPSFNSFKTINANQAWSLFFTGGREDQKLDSKPQISLFFTSILLALGALGFVRPLIMRTFFPA